jgi:predicted secreted acid phosphatase
VRGDCIKSGGIVVVSRRDKLSATSCVDKSLVAERAAAVNAARQKFSTQFIVLPNPMYGDWESAIYNYNPLLKEGEKAKLRREALRTDSEAGVVRMA